MIHLAIEPVGGSHVVMRMACGAVLGSRYVDNVNQVSVYGEPLLDCPRCLVRWDEACEKATEDKGVWETMREAARW